MTVSIRKLAKGKPTAAQIKRNEEKNERGVCRIQKKCGNRQGFETVGCGSLVKLQAVSEWHWSQWIEYAIITSNKVFQQAGFDVRKYRVDFKKSESMLETFELHDAVSGSILQDPASGLTVIPLDSRRSSVFRHGLLKKKCSVLKHSPFKVEFLHEDQRNQDGLCCHMVADDPSRNCSFGVKPHELNIQDSSGQFSLSNFASSTHVLLGAAILQRKDNEWSLVGVLNSDPSNSETSLPTPVWLSSETFTNLRPVEVICDGAADAGDSSDDDDDDDDEDIFDDDDNDDDDYDSDYNSVDREDSANGSDAFRDGNDKDFKNLLQQIHQTAGQGFENLKRKCGSIKLSSLDLDERVFFRSVEVDGTSKRLLPASRASKYVPIETTADGNCLFRAASILAFGHEHRHEEMRVRTVIELAVNSEFYLADKDVRRRLKAEIPTLKLDHDSVKTEFETDVLNSACDSAWASYWHLQALGTVCDRLVQSVYPDHGRRDIREYYDVVIIPRSYNQDKEPLTIMWTNTTGNDATEFTPNHFVPLISAEKITTFRNEVPEPKHKGRVPSEGADESMEPSQSGNKLSSEEHTEEIKQVKSNTLEQKNDNEIMKGSIQESQETESQETDQLTNDRLLTKVTDIPYAIYSDVCLKLNLRDEMSFKDFRLLGEKLGYSRNTTRNLGQKSLNATDELLRRWCDSNPQATVEKLIALLKEDDFTRLDVVEILEECPQLSIKVTDVSFAIYRRVCLKLNNRDEMFFKDFRLLGEKLGYSKDVTRNLEQNSSRTNPTNELLQMWCISGRQATVGRLIELLKEDDLQRMDVVEILEDWVKKKASK